MQKIKYNLSYTIPNIPRIKQRGNKQTLRNLSKQDLSCWTAWLDKRKIDATYKITIN